MKTRRLSAFAFVLFLLCLLAAPLRAQLSSGSILGAVTDAGGAVIPGVVVTVANPSINLSRTVVTNEDGNFRVDQLPVGTYTVTLEKAGFRKEVRSNVRVDIDQRVRMDAALTTGAVSETVNVTADASLLQRDDSALGQVVEERKIVTLPLNGRNFSQLAYIVPGAFAPRPGSNLGNRGGFAVAGLHESYNQFLLDGINNNGAGTMEINARINIDAVGEFKVQTGVYQAQYGRYSGAQVDVVTKSGTNEMHGTAFAFTRNDNLDTRNPFDTNIAKGAPLPEFKRHQYGGTIGGPILRDRLFFFAGFQGQRQAKFVTSTPSVPLPQFFTGDLSAYAAPIRDPQKTGACTAADRTACFPGNLIPSSRISPIALKFQSFWPAPIRAGLARNATALIPTPDNFTQPTGKVNWHLNSRHAFNATYNFYDNKFLEILGNDLPQFVSDSLVRSQSFSLGETWMISATMINEFRAGFSRLNRSRLSPNRDRNYNQEFGIPGTAADTEQAAWGVPLVNITGFSLVGDGSTLPQPRIEMPISASDTVSLQRGNHSFKFGGDYFAQVINGALLLANGRGQFVFTGSVTGNAFADFLLGLPAQTIRQPPLGPITSYSRRHSFSLFAQDDWRVSRALTLNLGVRYDAFGTLNEKNGKAATFDPSLNGGRGGIRMVGTNPFWDNSVATYQRLFPALTIARGSERLYEPDRNNVAPRIGLAWTPLGKTVVRAGYGIFFQIQEAGFNEFFNNPPFNLSQTFSNAAAGIAWSNPFGGVAGAPSLTVVSIDPNLATPYVQRWTLDIQREVPGGIVLDAAYVGNKGTHVFAGGGPAFNFNQATLVGFLDSAGRRTDTNSRKPFFQKFGLSQGLDYFCNCSSNNYNALQLKAEKRFSQGYSFLAHYTISRNYNFDGDYFPIDASLNYGPNDTDRRHVVVLTNLLELPFGKGKKYLNGASRAVDLVLGGWQVNQSTNLSSGLPFSLSYQNCGDDRDTGPCRVSLSGDVATGDGSRDSAGRVVWFQSAAAVLASPGASQGAFTRPQRGTFGNSGRNAFRGPGFWQTDVSLMKNIVVTERVRGSFHWELFNFFNNVNLGQPNTCVDCSVGGNGTSGKIEGTAFGSTQRRMQFGLRFQF